MKQIKVLHIVHDFLNGGIESFLYYLTQSQKNNPNVNVAVLCCQKKEKVTNQRIINTKMTCYFVEIRPWDLRLSQYAQVVKIANHYDIVHVHVFKPILAFFLVCSKSKLLFTNHSAGEDGRESTLSTKIKEFLFRFYLNHCVHFITNNSHYTKKFWVEKKGIKHKNNEVVYNGVFFNRNRDSADIDTFEINQYEGKFIVGTTCRFIKWKRIEKLIMAFSDFLHEKDDTILLLVGDGPERVNLVRLAEGLGIRDKVFFTGFRTNVTDYQSIMNVCVFPSNCEPFGLVAIECLYLGKSVLVFRDGGGITEIVEQIEPENIVDTVDDLVCKLDSLYWDIFKGPKTAGMASDNKVKRRIEFAKSFDAKYTDKVFFDVYNKLVS